MGKKMFKSPKGVNDVLPEEQVFWQHIEKKINRITRIYGYEKLGLPIFESTE
jgi:histidyl-tRNA synthetase